MKAFHSFILLPEGYPCSKHTKNSELFLKNACLRQRHESWKVFNPNAALIRLQIFKDHHIFKTDQFY